MFFQERAFLEGIFLGVSGRRILFSKMPVATRQKKTGRRACKHVREQEVLFFEIEGRVL